MLQSCSPSSILLLYSYVAVNTLCTSLASSCILAFSCTLHPFLPLLEWLCERMAVFWHSHGVMTNQNSCAPSPFGCMAIVGSECTHHDLYCLVVLLCDKRTKESSMQWQLHVGILFVVLAQCISSCLQIYCQLIPLLLYHLFQVSSLGVGLFHIMLYH